MAFIIEITDEYWQILASLNNEPLARYCAPARDNYSAIAEDISGLLKANGKKTERVIVVVTSEWCLCASVATNNLPRKHRQEAMTYRFEEKMPLPAEQIVVDFIQHIHGALGCGLRPHNLPEILVAFEKCEIEIQIISPLILLALQNFLEEFTEKYQIILWQNEKHIHFFTVENGRPTSWYQLPAKTFHINHSLSIELLDSHHVLNAAAVNFSEQNKTILNQFSSSDLTVTYHDSTDLNHHALLISTSLITEKTEPWINFRRGQLSSSDSIKPIRKALNFCVITAAIFMLIFTLCLYFRAFQYKALIVHDDAEMQQQFLSVFPNQDIPINIRARLESEVQKHSELQAARYMPQQQSALQTMYEILRRLPDNLRLKIQKIQIDYNRFTIEGQVRTLSDVDSLAMALRKLKGFTVTPPRAQKASNQAVDFTIRGEWKNDNFGVPHGGEI